MTLPYRLVSGYHAWSALASPAIGVVVTAAKGVGEETTKEPARALAKTAVREPRLLPGPPMIFWRKVLGLWVPANGWPPRPWHKVQANWKQAMKEMVPWT